MKSDDEAKDYVRLDTWLLRFSIYTSIATGFFMSIIRAQEPYFKFLIKQRWSEWFGLVVDENDKRYSQQYVNDSLATFLTSSLNVELVHVILDAITNGEATTMIDHTVNHLNFQRDEFFKETVPRTIDTIIIRNPEKWKTVKLPDFLEQKNQDEMIHSGTIKLNKD